LGETFSAIDIYFSVMLNWWPGKAWFRRVALRSGPSPALEEIFEYHFG
jgi:hypothetical protein